MAGFNFVLFLFLINRAVNADLDLKLHNPVFDPEFYENVVDSELCELHLSYISRNPSLRIKFLDYGLRFPRQITLGGTTDFGSYHECLRIKEVAEENVINGKYCMIEIPLEQDISLNDMTKTPDWLEMYPNITDYINKHDIYELEMYKQSTHVILNGRKPEKTIDGIGSIAKLSIKMAMCLPKSCTTKRALDVLYNNVTQIGLQYKEQFCRLPGDKTWVPADTVATTLLSLLGLVTILSTSYDVYYSVIMKIDSKSVNTLLRSFSIYTNTRRILNFTSTPTTIECIDGIRAYAMVWIILGHTFSSHTAGGIITNILDADTWSLSKNALWLMAASLSVDTFFTLSGILVVYTMAGKANGITFLKNLHLFYLNRLLRLFPILAFVVLLQTSVLNRAGDGPVWNYMALSVENCRVYWWSTLVHLQNYLNPFNMCLSHSWYVTVDTQLHIISPLVLFWVLTGNKTYAWISLAAGIVISLTASSIYIFINEFPSIRTLDPVETANYMKKYYWNTLTRSPTFFVGMMIGYILHLYKKKEVVIRKTYVALAWLGTALGAGLVFLTYWYSPKYIGENYTIDSFINAFSKPLWAACLGWMIFACYHGYGGIINWILAMNEIKLIGRVSYAMYIIHYPIMLVYIGASATPAYFNVASWLYLFFGHFAVAFLAGLIITILVDSPASVLIKHFLGGPKKSHSASKETATTELRL